MSTKSYSQTVEELGQEIEKAQKEIELSKKLLGSVHDKQKSGETALRLLQSNINNRKKIVTSLDKQVKLINNNIYGNNREIGNLKTSLKSLKEEYSKAVINRYKDQKQSNFLLFIFSSDNFYEMNLRGKYLEYIARFSKEKSKKISSTQSEIAKKNSSLISQQSEVKELLYKRNSELSTLSKEEKQSKEMLLNLSKEEKTLNSTITKNSQTISKLQAKIKELIEDELRNKSVKSDEEKRINVELSTVFSDNRGKFPPPIEGVIVSNFGLSSDPLQKNIKIRNNGVNITPSSTTVRCIYNGEVVKVFFFQGLNNSIMVRHGNYLTVYSNLTKVSVEQGDKVKTGQKLGSISSSDPTNMFHFEIWQDKTPMDPQKWINF